MDGEGFEGRRVPPPELGPAIRGARLRQGLGLRQAASAARVSHVMWIYMESGRRCPSAETARRIRSILDLTAEESAVLDAATVADAGRSHVLARGGR